MFGGVLALLVGVAYAGDLTLVVDPGANTRLLPAVVPGRVDIAVRGNSMDLAGQVQSVHTRDWISAARALDTGGNWVLTFWMAKPSTGIEVVQAAGQITLRATSAPDFPLDAPTPKVSVGDVLAGKSAPVACAAAPIPIPLLPPGEEARLFREPPAPIPVPTWSDAEPQVVGWSEVDGTRALLAHGEGEKARLLYRLGALHRDLGHSREAAWYFKSAAAADASRAGIANLQAASALLAVGEWDSARAAGKSAAEAGAPIEAVLHLVAAIAVYEHSDQGGSVGRALAQLSPDPAALSLAGRLLAEAGCGGEAGAALDRALPYLNQRDAAYAMLLRGDAYVLEGKLDDAVSTYAQVRPTRLSPERAGVLRARTRILAMESVSVAGWQGHLAELERAGAAETASAAGCLYALAQAEDTLGQSAEAVKTYATLSRRFPELVAGIAGEQHWSALEARLGILLDEKRPLDALALHRAGWNDSLLSKVTDPRVLGRVAAEYGATGLPESALATFRVVADIERTRGLDSRDTVLAIAELYVANGDFADALDSVAWFKHHPLSADKKGELALLEGRAYAGLGDREKARASFKVAQSAAASHGAGVARTALLDADAGQCATAVPDLTSAAAEPPPGVDSALLSDALVRCLLATGHPEAAIAPALAAAGSAVDDQARGVRTWQAARLSPDSGNGLLAEAATQAPGVWGQLAREEAAQKEFSDRLSGPRKP